LSCGPVGGGIDQTKSLFMPAPKGTNILLFKRFSFILS
jgi:hypothetical protein